MSPANGGRSRSGSPPGGSTVTTSAPRSASSRPASAPRRSVKSTTRRCASGGGMRPGAYHAFRPAHSLRKCLRMRHGACAHGLPGAVLPSSRVADDEVRRHLGLMAADTETFADLRLTARLRSATAIMLAIVPVLLALDLRYQPASFPGLLLFYGLHVLMAGGAHLATFTPAGRRRPDHVALVLIAGMATNINAYFHRTPANPALAADVLTLLMMSSAMFFSWSPVRHLIVCVVTCGGFALAGLTVPDAPPAFGYALCVLVLGAIVVLTGS